MKNERGQAMVFGALTLFCLVSFAAATFNVGQVSAHRIEMQNAADQAALAGAWVEADVLSEISWINEGMAYLYYNMMRYSVDTTVYGVLAELKEHGPPYPSDALVGVSDPVGTYDEAYDRAQTWVEQGRTWTSHLQKLEAGMAIAAPGLIRQEIFRVALAHGAEKVAIFPDLAFYPGGGGELTLVITKTATGWSLAADNGYTATVDVLGPGSYRVTSSTSGSFTVVRNSTDQYSITDSQGRDTVVTRTQTGWVVSGPDGTFSVAPGPNGGDAITTNGVTEEFRRDGNGNLQQWQNGAWTDMAGGTMTIDGTPVPISQGEILMGNTRITLEPLAIHIDNLRISFPDNGVSSPVSGGSAPSLVPSVPSLVPSAPPLTPSGSSLVPGDPPAIPGGPSLIPGGPSLIPGGPSLIPGGPSMIPGGPSLLPGGSSLPPSPSGSPSGDPGPGSPSLTPASGSSSQVSGSTNDVIIEGWIGPARLRIDSNSIVVNDLSSATADNRWRRWGSDLSRHRMRADSASQWTYELVVEGPILQTEFNRRRFGVERAVKGYAPASDYTGGALPSWVRDATDNPLGWFDPRVGAVTAPYHQTRLCWLCNGVGGGGGGNPACTVCLDQDNDSDARTDVRKFADDAVPRNTPSYQSVVVPRPYVLTDVFFRFGINVGVWREKATPLLGSAFTNPAWGTFAFSSAKAGILQDETSSRYTYGFTNLADRDDWVDEDNRNLYGQDWGKGGFEARLVPVRFAIRSDDIDADQTADSGTGTAVDSGANYLLRGFLSTGWFETADDRNPAWHVNGKLSGMLDKDNNAFNPRDTRLLDVMRH